MKNDEILGILSQVKLLAKRYKDLTGKPLGVTGEVAEFSAATLLGLDLVVARHPGYDATRKIDGKMLKYQIKGRCVADRYKGGQRISRLSENSDCDFVLLVLLDEDLEPRNIYEAKWGDIDQALRNETQHSKARTERRQLSIRKFISIAIEVWPNDS